MCERLAAAQKNTEVCTGPIKYVPIEDKQNLYLYAAMVLRHLIQTSDINLSEKITVGG
jgi:hypothetical protein